MYRGLPQVGTGLHRRRPSPNTGQRAEPQERAVDQALSTSDSAMMAQEPAPRRGLVGLALIVLAAGAVRLAFSSSISGNDDLAVAGCALRMLNGMSILQEGHYCARLGLTVPLAAVFGVAGTGSSQLSLLPALASLGAMLVAWGLGAQLLGRSVGLAAAAVIGLFPMDVEYAGLVFPDVPQGVLVASAGLCVLKAGRASRGRADAWAVAAGALWAWAYYVKLDAFMFAPVLLVAVLSGLVRWRHAVVMGTVAVGLIGIELVTYGVLAGDPLRHLHLESAGSNEVLASGMDYRDLMTFPKSMFLVPYETGIAYLLWLLAVGTALTTRSRPLVLLVAWCLIWQAWLMFGADPLSGFRLKPQLGRYLLSWEVPMAVLVGWFWIRLLAWRRVVAGGVATVAVAALLVLGPFNQLSFKAAQATRLAVGAALRNSWFPLYPDVQSIGIVQFLLHGRPEAARVFAVQRHDFLKGVTTFEPIPKAPAWLLVNETYARQLQVRNLVHPIDPASFGLTPTKVFQVDRPASALSYVALDVLGAVAGLVPGPFGRKAQGTMTELVRPGDAVVWRLDRPDVR